MSKLKCNHCGQIIERGILNVVDHVYNKCGEIKIKKVSEMFSMQTSPYASFTPIENDKLNKNDFMRHIREPLTLPKHPQLLHEINQMSMRIKTWKLNNEEMTLEQMEKLQSHFPNPKWSEIEDLLMRSYTAINEQRENPRKY